MSEVNRLLADRYLLKSLIGQGGMADVYLAEDQVLGRKVAVKILRSSLTGDPIYIKRFHREASAAAAINHKNIVSIYDVGDEDDLYYIVMEYVKGQTLKDLIRVRGALHYIEALDIMKQVVSAVSTAHSMGIVHRDLKPQNILITDSGIVKITDFGIASIQSLSQVTQTNTIMGSLHYLAPEIAKGEKATPQSDIYALGIVFYELLRGEVPFNGESPVNIALKHMRDEIPSVREFNPSIPQSVENIIIKATAKNPNDRFVSALDMLNELNTCLDHPDVPKLSFGAPVDEPTIVAGNTDFFTRDRDGNETVSDQTIVEEPRVTRATKQERVVKKKKRSKKPLIILLVIALAVVLIVAGMNAFSGGSKKTYTMPNLVGMTKSQAKSELSTNDLTGKVTYRTELSNTYDEGKIIKTSPASGKTMAKDTAITITVSSGKWIIMKDYTGEKYDDAKSELEELGFTVSRRYKSDDDFATGEVIGQSVSSGEKIDPNGDDKSITLTVSKGVSITVPYLYGDSISSASSTLKSLGFSVKTSVLSAPTSKSEASKITSSNVNTVIKQSIAPYTVVTKKGTSITLYYYDKVPGTSNTDDNTDEKDDGENTSQSDSGKSSSNSSTNDSSTKSNSSSSSTDSSSSSSSTNKSGTDSNANSSTSQDSGNGSSNASDSSTSSGSTSTTTN